MLVNFRGKKVKDLKSETMLDISFAATKVSGAEKGGRGTGNQQKE